MIKTSNFVKRQTRTSDFSYFKGSWQELELLVTENYSNGFFKQGYREGVVLVKILEGQLNKFFSAVVPSSEVTSSETIVEARREGEVSYSKSVAYGVKKEAKEAFVVLYSKEVLEEDPLNTDLTGEEWEIISINCSHCKGKEIPMTPIAKARNILACTDHPFGKGGTCDSNSTAIELAECIAFWSTHCLIREKE